MPTRAHASDDLEEKRLLQQVAHGDERALSRLYQRYGDVLFSLALSITRDAHEAEEVVQDAFLRIWNKAHTYDPSGARPFRWVFHITKRLAISRLRSKARRYIPTSEDDPTFSRQLTFDDLEKRASSEEREAVRRALHDLPDDQRECLELALFSGLTHQEISDASLRPLGTVKAWIRRGMQQLKEALQS